jgi:hypothetical protein
VNHVCSTRPRCSPPWRSAGGCAGPRCGPWVARRPERDGGWGEASPSYRDPEWIGRVGSTRRPRRRGLCWGTAAAAKGHPPSTRGLAFLSRSAPTARGTSPGTGTGFPVDFMINCHLPPGLPVTALGGGTAVSAGVTAERARRPRPRRAHDENFPVAFLLAPRDACARTCARSAPPARDGRPRRRAPGGRLALLDAWGRPAPRRSAAARPDDPRLAGRRDRSAGWRSTFLRLIRPAMDQRRSRWDTHGDTRYAATQRRRSARVPRRAGLPRAWRLSMSNATAVGLQLVTSGGTSPAPAGPRPHLHPARGHGRASRNDLRRPAASEAVHELIRSEARARSHLWRASRCTATMPAGAARPAHVQRRRAGAVRRDRSPRAGAR